MKKRVLIALLLISLFAVSASAHGGRTDANGGHHDYQNKSGLGSYHYHHGYPAHLHPGGVCPYNSAASSAGTDGAATISDRYKEGYGDGYDAGYAEGYNVGQTDAQESFKSEKQSAVNSAYKEGKADGYAGRDRVYEQYRKRAIRYAAIAGAVFLCICLTGICVVYRAFEAQNRRCAETDAELAKKHAALMHIQKEFDSLSKANGTLESQNALLSRQRSEFHNRLQSQTAYVHELQQQLHALPKALPVSPNKGQQTPPRREGPQNPPVKKTFDHWDEATHKTPEQQRRIQRALTEPFKVVDYRDFIYSIQSPGSGHTYYTTLRSCSCIDFKSNTAGKAPCKHIYFLAKHLGFPIKTYLE